MNCPKCHKSDEVVTRADGRYCLDCGERVEPAPLDAAAGSAFRDELHALINKHASQIGPEVAAYWLSTMAHSALAHLVWMPGETKQAYEHLGKVCDLLPMPNTDYPHHLST